MRMLVKKIIMQKKLIIYSSPNPYFNIALDEALFLHAIESRDTIIRLWENKTPCIYLGLSKKYKQEILLENCQKDNIPMIRRFSGGGTVLHSKGNLNFTFIFPLEKHKNFENLKNSYKEIFLIIKKILEPYFKKNISLKGASDFCIGDKKFSGNAQARRKNTLLHHGTILVNNDLSLISQYLSFPADRPCYRKDRSHQCFLTTLQQENKQISIPKIIKNFKKSFPGYQLSKPMKQDLFLAKKLMKEKYLLDSWNLKL